MSLGGGAFLKEGGSQRVGLKVHSPTLLPFLYLLPVHSLFPVLLTCEHAPVTCSCRHGMFCCYYAFSLMMGCVSSNHEPLSPQAASCLVIG